LTPVETQDGARTVTMYQFEGKDVVKKLNPGFAMVFEDDELAIDLATKKKVFS